ncbi:hypothetical protein CBM2600_A30016 [Cupriavidus taiwanensis]|nr:hypothetical protein CBM2600_A30016 [Cupriavidus taiwanensis]
MDPGDQEGRRLCGLIDRTKPME